MNDDTQPAFLEGGGKEGVEMFADSISQGLINDQYSVRYIKPFLSGCRIMMIAVLICRGLFCASCLFWEGLDVKTE